MFRTKVVEKVQTHMFNILFTHQQMHFLLSVEKFKFTWKYT